MVGWSVVGGSWSVGRLVGGRWSVGGRLVGGFKKTCPLQGISKIDIQSVVYQKVSLKNV